MFFGIETPGYLKRNKIKAQVRVAFHQQKRVGQIGKYRAQGEEEIKLPQKFR
jgi:hypothetical protein